MRILLGVSGGIAAYKTALLLRLLKEDGHEVDVVPTEASLEFVGRATWEALSGHEVTTGVFEAVDTVRHVRLGQQADLIVVAPATADLLSRVRTGRANDLLSSSLLASEAPKLLVPAMHTEMWRNPATVENVQVLRDRGITVMEPAVGRLTGKDSGPGRMPEPEAIHALILQLSQGQSAPAQGVLSGRRVVVTAGGTREPLDPVRYLGNRSSGKQGLALALAAAGQGAQVVLIAGIMDAPLPDIPANITVLRIETAAELHQAVLEQTQPQAGEATDVLVMAAAVADYRPATYAGTKMKKTDDGENPVIALERNPDILAQTVQRRAAEGGGPQVIIGFAAETGDEQNQPLALAKQKLQRKGCDLLVLNQVGENLVFGQDQTEIHILASPAAQKTLGDSEPAHYVGTKTEASDVVIHHAARLL